MTNSQSPPPAQGVRIVWSEIPASVRAAVEARLGSQIVHITSYLTGFSPGVAARLLSADRRHVFVKAVGPKPNPDVPAIHRREARITSLLPPTVPAPRLLWTYDDSETGWVVLVFEDIPGRHPAQPWQPDELDRVVEA